jgi:hypothetical protein
MGIATGGISTLWGARVGVWGTLRQKLRNTGDDWVA